MSAVATPSATEDPFAQLNAEQRAAVEHDIGVAAPRPLLVVAGAGSGKTNTLAHRVARLIGSGADPQGSRVLGRSLCPHPAAVRPRQSLTGLPS